MAFNPIQNLNQGIALAGNIQQQQQQNQLNELQQGIGQQIQQGGFSPEGSLDFQQLALLDPGRAQVTATTFARLDDKRKKAYFQDMREGRKMLEAGDNEGFVNLFSGRLQQVRRLNGDTQGTEMILAKHAAGDIPGIIDGLKRAEQAGIDLELLSDPLKARGDRTAGQREFESLTEGLTDEQKQQAKMIELGLSPRAVGSAVQTISQQGIEERIGDVKATINQRAKFGELTASRRSKVIDSGFNKIEKINASIGNIDRAITVLNSGAGVGSIEKFLPSFKAASVELDNIQKSMALDVIGSVTFGALSEGELNLAKEVALPTGLDTPQLIDYLNRRKTAQNKLRDYYSEQINFLDQGGTVAGFLRSKDREQGQPQQAQEQQQAQQPAQQAVAPQTFNSSVLGRSVSEQDIADTLQANPGLTREQLLQQLGVN